MTTRLVEMIFTKDDDDFYKLLVGLVTIVARLMVAQVVVLVTVVAQVNVAQVVVSVTVVAQVNVARCSIKIRLIRTSGGLN